MGQFCAAGAARLQAGWCRWESDSGYKRKFRLRRPPAHMAQTRRTQMTATEQLRHEHEAITVVLSILEKLCQRLANGEEVNPEHFGEVLEFIQVFADQCHHGKEEQFLFPALEAVGIPKAGGPIGVMLSEHEHGRAFIRQLAAAWQKHRSGELAAAAVVIASARDYSAFLKAHIFKENNVLFPMAEARLSADS